MKNFNLCVIYKVKENRRKQFIEEIVKSGVADTIREENGCIRYEYFLSFDDENNVLLFEEWENEECQKIHMTQPHMSILSALKEKYIESVSLIKAEPLK